MNLYISDFEWDFVSSHIVWNSVGYSTFYRGHEGMGQYNWVVWRVVLEMIEDTQKKLRVGPLSEVQLNGFCVSSLK